MEGVDLGLCASASVFIWSTPPVIIWGLPLYMSKLYCVRRDFLLPPTPTHPASQQGTSQSVSFPRIPCLPNLFFKGHSFNLDIYMLKNIRERHTPVKLLSPVRWWPSQCKLSSWHISTTCSDDMDVLTTAGIHPLLGSCGSLATWIEQVTGTILLFLNL